MGGGVARGAEEVGKAQIIVGEMGQPFVLEGLFGAADEGAFGSGRADEEMGEEGHDEGEVQGAELIDEDG
jgi:nuclear GTP-binding protein